MKLGNKILHSKDVYLLRKQPNAIYFCFTLLLFHNWNYLK